MDDDFEFIHDLAIIDGACRQKKCTNSELAIFTKLQLDTTFKNLLPTKPSVFQRAREMATWTDRRGTDRDCAIARKLDAFVTSENASFPDMTGASCALLEGLQQASLSV